jgi:hypothetical protein
LRLFCATAFFDPAESVMSILSSARSATSRRRRRAGLAACRAAAPLLGPMLLAAIVSSCGSSQPQFAPACPSLGLLSDAADITRFREGGRDLTDMVVDGRITAIPADCKRGEKNTVRASLRVTMDLTRGPAATQRTMAGVFFVAAMEGDQVLDEQNYTINVEFPPNVDRVSATSDPIDLDFPVTPTKSAAAYKIYVGFRLTPEELAYTRRRGPR